MRILVTADTLGGVWTYTRELVSGLALRGIEVILVSFGGIPADAQTGWLEGLRGVDYRPTAFKLEWMQDSESDLAASMEFLEAVIEETRPDLLHLNQFYYGALKSNLPRVVVAHSDVVSWWAAVHEQEPPDSAWMRWYRKIVRRGIEAATVVIAPSVWMLDQVSSHFARPKNGFVVYNGRTAALFNPRFTKDDLIVSVGRQWDQGKNAILLLRRPMPVPVCIVGSDRHPEPQGRAVELHQPQAGVRFEGQMDEAHLGSLLARASTYAATSRYEPFGLALVEAALSRCAIVASDIPTFRELWDGAAVFFRDNDPDSLCRVLEQLAANRALLRSYGNLALHRAQERFSAGRMVGEYMALYRKLGVASAMRA
jgi:glycogen synthase